ncbi:MAG: DUF1847 domain-containing protein [Oscillospiraceae bacterium]|nr:DUF1847 domain-containing protein [Oscillospiraceae bacterium]
MANKKCLTCSACNKFGCFKNEGEKYPEFCLTKALDESLLNESLAVYDNDETLGNIARVSAAIEGEFYGRMTRVEETIEFIKRIGAKKVGIATCVGLIPEARLFAKLLDKEKISYYTVGCKVGAVDKTRIGIPEEKKLNGGCGHESMCNPVLQAKILNEQKTDFNIMIGLCVGHDSLFLKHVEAPTTILIVKDRVLVHNPAAALYGSTGMYSRFK